MGEEWIEDHMFEVEEYYGWKMDELDYLHMIMILSIKNK